MAQASSSYSYTERKRIRKSFGKRESVLNVPYLLTMQRESYVAFLQKDVAPQKRKPEGLQAAFLSAFPIVSHNGFVEMKFIEFNMAKPTFDTRECQQRGLTYAAAVRAKLQMIIYDRETSTSNTISRNVTLSGAAKVMSRCRHSSTSYLGASNSYFTNSSRPSMTSTSAGSAT